MLKLSGKIASLDIDSQKGFTPLCPDELPVPEGHTIANELNQQAEFADYRIGSKDAHSKQADWLATPDKPPLTPIEGEHVDVTWPQHCVPGTPGFELLSGLPHPSDYDFFVWKGIEPDMHPYGACFHDFDNKLSTGLIEFLSVHQVRTLIVGGLATEYCVKTTVLQLLEADFTIIVNQAACRGLDSNSSAQAYKDMQRAGARIIASCSELSEAP